jgi:mRNA-decapping enzyme subunit 2
MLLFVSHRLSSQCTGLDDLSVRFIVNLPREELESVERICFQVEEAQWFYEDFVRPLNPKLPSLTLRQFSMKIFQHCPLFSSYDAEVHSKAFSEFLAYKTRVPVRGAILLNETLDHVILVKGWKKGANWSFPRGKINKDEKDVDCAIREVYEETGFDVRAAGLAGTEENARSIEVTMREQHMKLFVFAGVPMSTHFEPRTRKEISKIQWYKLSDLPTLKKAKQQQQNTSLQDATHHANKFYMVAPFLNPLRKIISTLKRGRPASQMVEVVENTQSDAGITSSRQHDANVSGALGSNDMLRLMSQLRQSHRAVKDTDLPEVSSTFSASMTPTAVPQVLPGTPHAEIGRENAAARRENKANAMLSILRGGSNTQASLQGALPQTPFEQILPSPSEPPPSPKMHALRTTHNTIQFPPPGFPVLPKPLGSAGRDPHSAPDNLFVDRFPGYDVHHHTVANINNSDTTAQMASVAPYRQTGDPGFSSTSITNQGGIQSVPPASMLPPPKLTQHSSTLLDIFKSPVNVKANLVSPNIAAPPRPELSVTSPEALHQRQLSSLPTHVTTQQSSSTPALAAPAASGQKASPKQFSQQEALLNLFRPPKPSPSLVPPHDPVELSAQGSPTQARAPSVDQVDIATQKSLQNGKVMIQKRPTQKTGVTSATVTGPVNVPQFEKNLQLTENKKTTPSEASGHLQAQRTLQQPIRILARPVAVVDKDVSSSTQGGRLPTVRNSDASRRATASFQPQILKRPEAVSRSGTVSPKTAAPQDVPSISSGTLQASQPPTLTDRRPSHSQEQKSALLALFGKSHSHVVSPMPLRTTGVVSPLSEKPPIGSELPSPLGLSKSRLGSLQEGGIAETEPARSGGASPGDKKFLLGFLDGVVKEGSRVARI